MRYLYIKSGIITNIVEHPDVPPETSPEGDDIVLAVNGLESCGDAFDMTGTLKDRRLAKAELFIFKELFRLTNAVRTLNAQAVLTQAQYVTYLKTQI